MSRALALAALILLAASAPLARSEAPVRRGASMAEVREQFGRPEQVARVILFRRHIEQWQYAGGRVVEFDCVRGEDPAVVRKFSPPR